MPTTRRSFIAALLALPFARALIGQRLHSPSDRDGYVPVGYLECGDALARSVDHITLNGQRVSLAFALNDVDGWVMVYEIIDGDGRSVAHRVNHVRLTGDVRVVWKDGFSLTGSPRQRYRVSPPHRDIIHAIA